MTDAAAAAAVTTTKPLLDVEDLHVTFQKGNQSVQAVAGISFALQEGETLGLVGESGCGKSTTGRAIVQVERATSGQIRFGDTELTSLSRGDLRTLRTQVQMIFQDPISSLNPRRRVRDIVAEPLNIWSIGTKEERQQKAYAMLEQVGIDPYLNGGRRPREFSGGQCQRISIARALVLRPKLLVCDEIVSALDVSVQAQILNLLEDLKKEFGLTVLFIAHDLAVVKNVSDRVAVMYLGRLCEIAPSDVLYQRARPPLHGGTAQLRRRTRPRGQPDLGAADGRAAQPDQPSVGLSLPHPLPAGGTTLRPRGARDATDRSGPPGGLPLPHWELSGSPSGTARPRVALAACGRFPDLLDEGPLILGALEAAGVKGSTAVWNDPAVDWSGFDLVVANGAWDNIHHVSEFLAWVDMLERNKLPVVNSPATLRWNLDKRYLRELSAAGVPVVPTEWVEPGADPSTARPSLEGEVVVKPSVSGGGFRTARYEPHERDLALAHVVELVASGRTAMVQPYQEAVDDEGEVGLIFLGGAYSHAIHKDPMIRRGAGALDSLIDNMVITPATASPAQLSLGRLAVGAAERLLGPTTYARVDTVTGPDDAPLLLELELLDPVLFFATDPSKADGFAQVLANQLGSGLSLG